MVEYLNSLDQWDDLGAVYRITTKGITLRRCWRKAQKLIGDTLSRIQKDILAIFNILIVAHIDTILLHRIYIELTLFALLLE